MNVKMMSRKFRSFQTLRRYVNSSHTDTKGRLFVVDVSINWPNNRKVGETHFLLGGRERERGGGGGERERERERERKREMFVCWLVA